MRVPARAPELDACLVAAPREPPRLLRKVYHPELLEKPVSGSHPTPCLPPTSLSVPLPSLPIWGGQWGAVDSAPAVPRPRGDFGPSDRHRPHQGGRAGAARSPEGTEGFTKPRCQGSTAASGSSRAPGQRPTCPSAAPAAGRSQSSPVGPQRRASGSRHPPVRETGTPRQLGRGSARGSWKTLSQTLARVTLGRWVTCLFDNQSSDGASCPHTRPSPPGSPLELRQVGGGSRPSQSCTPRHPGDRQRRPWRKALRQDVLFTQRFYWAPTACQA